MDATLSQETYLPARDQELQLAKVGDFMRAREQTGCGRSAAYFLSGASLEDRVELPEELYRALRLVVAALQNGLAVTVAPQSKTLTTQQAAELLGVSRPTVVRLLDSGEIPFERAGTHRRITARDLLEYRKRRRAAQYAALEATAVDDDEDLETTLDRLRDARKEIARRRRRQ
ncbi:helix-turn-helix domain-containing protein [Saccharomonospora sp. NPDC046836]|uniref:helix-turn-helix domain-containing protein n=1 Tax=Saccharomonospora sp. NPDC046836 TaxID=3156921 RepID=UPI0033EB013D